MSPIKLMVLFLCTPWNRKNQAPNHPDLCGSPPKGQSKLQYFSRLRRAEVELCIIPTPAVHVLLETNLIKSFVQHPSPTKTLQNLMPRSLESWIMLNPSPAIWRLIPETIDIDQWPNPSEKIWKKTTKDHAQQPPSAHYCHSLLLNVGARSSFSEVVKNSAYAIHPFFSTFHISILNQVSPFFIIRPAHYTSLGGYGPGHLVQ